MDVPYASPKAQSPNVNRVGGPMQNPSQNEVSLTYLTMDNLNSEQACYPNPFLPYER